MARISTLEPAPGQGVRLRLGHHLLAAVGRVGSGWGVRQRQAVLLDELGKAGRINLERVSVDSFSLRAVKGGT